MAGAGAGLVAVATTRQWEDYVPHGLGLVVDAEEDVVKLAWELERGGAGTGGVLGGEAAPPVGPAGLAVDRACFVYHAVPEEGRVERVRWSAERVTEPEDVLTAPALPALGPFVPAEPPADAVRAVAIAVDDESRMFVADASDGAVAVYDLADRRLLQRIRLPGRALDLVGRGASVVVLCDDEAEPLWRLVARRSPESLPAPVLPPGVTGRVVRAAAGAGGPLWGLMDGGHVVRLEGPPRMVGLVADATDIEVDGDGGVVVADRSGAAFLRFSQEDVDDPEQRPVVARAYDGRGIVRMPDGSIGYWTTAGRLRRAMAAMLRYEPAGSVRIGPLDGLEYNQSWGRVFVDACVPEGTRVLVAAVTGDDADEVPEFGPAVRMHCRETGADVPWARREDDDPYETLEVPVGSGAGRYLWVRIELEGTTRATPKVRALRAEYPGPELLRRLPRTYSRDPAPASFLSRYLALAAGLLGDIERRAQDRHVLLDPHATPREALPWLAGLIGLTLDDRWSDRARRTLVQEAACLFRSRGTKGGLERMIEIFLDHAPRPAPAHLACRPGAKHRRVRRGPRIVELYRVRGLGGGMLSDAGPDEAAPAWSSAVVGGGLRVGGAAGVPGSRPAEGTAQDAISRSAHRFAVVIPARLDEAQERALRDLLEEHKPAHTAYELCTVDAGMRVGRGLYAELTSMVGPGSGFEQAQVGGSALGRDAVVGRPAGGISPGASRVGRTTRLER